MAEIKDRIIRVDCDPPLYFGPFTKEQAEEASGELQDLFEHGTGTYMMLASTNPSDEEVNKALEFNHPDYVEPEATEA